MDRASSSASLRASANFIRLGTCEINPFTYADLSSPLGKLHRICEVKEQGNASAMFLDIEPGVGLDPVQPALIIKALPLVFNTDLDKVFHLIDRHLETDPLLHDLRVRDPDDARALPRVRRLHAAPLVPPVSGDGRLLGDAPQNWGWSAAKPVPGDYDKDGITDLAVYDPATGTWYVRQSSNGQMLNGGPLGFGWSAALPVVR